MAKTIKYTGSEKNWDELAYTGKQSVWYPGWTDSREDSEANTLIGTGLFVEVRPDSPEALNARVTALEAAGPGGSGVADGDKGDITVAGTGAVWTIENNAVTNAKAADMATATIKGRATAGTGDPEDLTATQATALLNTFTTSLKGLAPASGGGTTNFLRADGTWAAPSGGSGVTDGDKGDVTVSSSGTAWTIDNDTVTNAKLANVATATIKGRATAGTGDPEDLTATQAKTLLAIGIVDVSGLQAALDAKLSEDLATDITTAKTSFSNSDKGILLDAAASDAPKTFTGAVMRTQPVAALGTTGTVDLDLSTLTGTIQTIAASGNITFTTSNRAAGRAFELRIDANGGTRTLTWPGWVAYGAALPTSLASGKVLRVAISCTGTTEGSIDATSALSV